LISRARWRRDILEMRVVEDVRGQDDEGVIVGGASLAFQ